MVKRLEWTPELIGKFWDGVAGTALDDLSFGRVAGPEFLDIVSPFLSSSGRHLDYGAGSGHIVRLMLDRSYATAGFEPSPERQAALEKAVGQQAGFLGVVGPESEARFDVVLLLEVIEHVLDSDLSGVLDRINRFLPVGGRVIVSPPNREDLERASVYCPVSDLFFHPWQHVRSFTAESLTALMNDHGFERRFLGLVDFSADREMYEQFKRIRLSRDLFLRHVDSQKEVGRSIRESLRNPPRAKDQTEDQGSYLRRLERALHHVATIWLMGRRGRAAVKFLVEVVFPQAQRLAADPSPYDLRLGRETTIIYAGEKMREAESVGKAVRS